MITAYGREMLTRAASRMLPLDGVFLVPMRYGDELAEPGRVRARHETVGSSLLLRADWPDGTVVDEVGLAASVDGPILVVCPLQVVCRYPDTTAHVAVTVTPGEEPACLPIVVR